MQRFRILSLTIASLLTAATLHAQDPAPAPATPPATPAPATPPADPGKKAKLSPAEAKGLAQAAEVLLLQRSLAEAGKGKAKEYPDVGKFAESAHAEILAAWTPLVSLAQARGVEVPTTLSKGDKSDIDKLGKVKPDKYVLEFFDLYAKHSKRSTRTLEAAAKGFTDPELKTTGTNLAKMISAQADKSETTYKELKSPKKK